MAANFQETSSSLLASEWVENPEPDPETQENSPLTGRNPERVQAGNIRGEDRNRRSASSIFIHVSRPQEFIFLVFRIHFHPKSSRITREAVNSHEKKGFLVRLVRLRLGKPRDPRLI